MENLNPLMMSYNNKVITYDHPHNNLIIPSSNNWDTLQTILASNNNNMENNITTSISSSTLLFPNYQPNNSPSSLIGQEMATLFELEAADQEKLNMFDHDHDDDDDDEEELGAMKEMMYKMAAMQPVDIDLATITKPKRRNVRISNDPQSVAARHRRERISERIRILQRLVPGGTKMDTASMLHEAIRYVKFLKRQIRILERSSSNYSTNNISNNLNSYFPHQLVGLGSSSGLIVNNSAPNNNNQASN